jgi:hypothetical protein
MTKKPLNFVDRVSNRKLTQYKQYSEKRMRTLLYSYELRSLFRPLENRYAALNTHEPSYQ